MNTAYYRTTNAIVIGPLHKRYSFHDKDGNEITKGYLCFATPRGAESWFAETHPEEYKKGVEMRQYD